MMFFVVGIFCLASIANAQQCGSVLHGNNGTLISPNYPNGYGPNLDCMWTIPGHGGMITLTFKDFELQEGTDGFFGLFGSCDYDYVEVLVGDRSHGTYCGTRLPGTVSANQDIHIRFVSDATINGKGFKLQFTVDHGGNDPCGERLDDNFGTVTSPNYPQNYPNNQYCTWTIPHTQYPVTVKFIDFELEEGGFFSSCSYDHLEIFDGRTSLGKFCGTDAPAVLTTTNGVRINFKSDSSVGQRGFKFTYRVAAPATQAPTKPTKPATDKPDGSGDGSGDDFLF
ncbi:PREDICTED: bone morphogenetic protein 1-like [Branchiostoma belcheri]|uniref:Bone morphogenetic protein 1-like n=1 Tax=Branchiostoma belcheri TaxID=7741 RepID=A0A6P5A6T0_BRABE|nr:PREDICTED: bone morphogenetic protein 1-like [Branchiostoma belcheri]